MKKFKHLIGCILVFICSFIFVFPSVIEAKTPVSSAIAPGLNPGDEDLGSIILYDDYTIIFNYKSRLKEVEIKVCNYAYCNTVQDVENKIYLGISSFL